MAGLAWGRHGDLLVQCEESVGVGGVRLCVVLHSFFAHDLSVKSEPLRARVAVAPNLNLKSPRGACGVEGDHFSVLLKLKELSP